MINEKRPHSEKRYILKLSTLSYIMFHKSFTNPNFTRIHSIKQEAKKGLQTVLQVGPVSRPGGHERRSLRALRWPQRPARAARRCSLCPRAGSDSVPPRASA